MKRVLLAWVSMAAAMAQTWSGSGSNGSDGALNLGANTPGVVNNVLDFDPIALNLDMDADNVYHFTTITIRDGIQVRFQANKTRRPGAVVVLASGAVTIGGVLNLSGESAHIDTNNNSLRRISIPGPGGYPGGVGGKIGGGAPTPGMGPGGGRIAPSSAPNGRGCPGAYTNAVVPSWCPTADVPPSYGTNLLQPLVGGSGGSGGWASASVGGAGGGAGGGAIRISSSVSIAFGTGLSGTAAQGCNANNHNILADGGNETGTFTGSAGAGGAVHLQAPVIAGCGTHVYARGGHTVAGCCSTSVTASEGRIRLDSNGAFSLGTTPAATANALTDVALPPSPPFLRIISINGVNVPASPKFDYASPDVLINSTSPVPVELAANNIPVNTPVTVFLTTDTGADITTTVNLTGSVANSTATANVTLPLGTARLIARAIW